MRERTLLVVVCGLFGCAPTTQATPSPATPAPSPAAAANPAAGPRKLLCAKIGLVTSSGREPTRSVPLDELAAEGAHMDVFVDGDMTRIHAELLGETTRQELDYRFQGGRLVCSDEMWTSIHTAMGGKEDGPPEFWRVDFRVFDANGGLVHASFDEAPGVDEQHRSAEETLAFAQELHALTD